MFIKGIILLVLFSGLLFVAYRFSLLGQNIPLSQPVTEVTNKPTISPIIVTTSLSQSKISTSSAKIFLLETPQQATADASFFIKWLIDNPKIATISHTAVHFGPDARPNAKLPSDYPEKSTIFKGTIPASFSAELKISLAGTYYYRAHAIVDDINVWSAENIITILPAATISATPTP